MHSLTHDFPAVLLAEGGSPSMSLHQPTHRQHPDNAQDPLRFRNLVRQLAASLREKYPARDIAALLRPFESLAADHDFRNHAGDGLAVLGAPNVSRHGTDVKQDDEDHDTEQFFRAVAAAVLKYCSQRTGQPLILAALSPQHHLFRAVSANPSLMDEAIDVHSDALSLDALRERAWQVVQPHYLQRLAGHVESFGAAASNGRGAYDLCGIAAAAVAGRVESLLIETDRLLPGRIDATSGEMTAADLAHPEVDDVLDDLGEIVLNKRGEVIVVPAERMPTYTGAAAIYRF